MDKERFILNGVFLVVVILSFVFAFHMAKSGIEPGIDPYWPETFEPIPQQSEHYFMDSVEIN